jgi:hypothetical protein
MNTFNNLNFIKSKSLLKEIMLKSKNNKMIKGYNSKFFIKQYLILRLNNLNLN